MLEQVQGRPNTGITVARQDMLGVEGNYDL